MHRQFKTTEVYKSRVLHATDTRNKNGKTVIYSQSRVLHATDTRNKNGKTVIYSLLGIRMQ
jgi:hypothetical protein